MFPVQQLRGERANCGPLREDCVGVLAQQQGSGVCVPNMFAARDGFKWNSFTVSNGTALMT
jgi:hypothetical protein